MMTAANHLDVIKMMERLRTRHEFYYGVRVRESPISKKLRIPAGFVFLGNDEYVWVPICPLSTPGNNTRACGVVFSGNLDRAYIEIAVPKAGSRTDRKHPQARPGLLGIVRKYGIAHDRDTTQYERYQLQIVGACASWNAMMSAVENYLDQNIRGLVADLSAVQLAKKPFSLAYSRQLMKDCVRKHIAKRKGIQDATTVELNKVYNSL